MIESTDGGCPVNVVGVGLRRGRQSRTQLRLGGLQGRDGCPERESWWVSGQWARPVGPVSPLS